MAAASLAALLAGHAAQASPATDAGSYHLKILSAPTTGDEFGFRGAMQQYAQGRSDRMFGALSSMLGGTAPQLNFVPTDSALTPNHISTNIADAPGAPLGTINADPLVTQGLIDNLSPVHGLAVNALPHEMAHTRQTQQTLAQLLTREGGAQAFADLEAAPAAKAAGIPYQPGNYDGAYADYVKQIMASKPQSWITAGQFGR